MSGAAAAKVDVADQPDAVSVTGYLDAVSGSRIFGWAWDKQRPQARIAIRVVAGGDTVAAMIADRQREDLAANGVGDGAHAFDVTLPDGISPGECEILAVCPETGETITLGRAPAAPAETNGSANGAVLPETIGRLVHGQRLLHGNLRAAILAIEELRKAKAEPAAEPEATAHEAAKDALAERIETLEAAVLRLDELVVQQGKLLPTLKRRAADHISRGLAGGAVFVAFVALFIALSR
jgi:hypothetical protein